MYVLVIHHRAICSPEFLSVVVLMFDVKKIFICGNVSRRESVQ